MAATVIPNMTSFGGMTNQSISRLINSNVSLLRLEEAIATASSGYNGTPGTEFEAASGTASAPPNNFGIQPDPNNPGAQGQSYSYAVGQLVAAWKTFWTAAQPYISQLDNGAAGL